LVCGVFLCWSHLCSLMRSAAEIDKAFRDAFFTLDRRISLFLCLPIKALDSLSLKKELDSIGQSMAPVAHEG